MPRDPMAGPTAPGPQRPEAVRFDLALIADMIEPGSRVLDIGCGNGDLLALLWHDRGVDGRGIEISQSGVHACVKQGLSVIQGDADTDLFDYPEHAFDYVVLSQTLQAVREPRAVLENLVRIGRHAVVSFPNFGYWRVRLQLLVDGRMPVTRFLPETWYETPNIHFCTIRDFVDLCAEIGITIERSMIVVGDGRAVERAPGRLANWSGEQAIFLLTRNSV